MAPRNLTLFFPDDRPAKPTPLFIDQINPTPFSWESHCREAAQTKQVMIDLLSADINYTEDDSDPAFVLEKPPNSWGLVHALMGIARRREDDGYGNRLPLAWEIRTASPAGFRADKDATRLYGLLRSLAAEPRDHETVEHTVHREFERDHPSEKNQIPAGKGSLRDVFIQDLAQQPSRYSDPVDAVSRLLPKWREMFRRAVDRGGIAIDPTQARRILEKLKKQHSVPLDPQHAPSIPIAKKGGGWYNISLLSVMADLLNDDFLDVAARFDTLLIVDAPNAKPRPGTVLEWYQVILELAGTPHDPAERLRTFANAVHERIHSAALNPIKEGLDDYMKRLAGDERGWLFIVLIAHSCLVGKDCNTLQKLATTYNYAHNHQLFRRPVHDHPGMFAHISSASAYAKQLRKALRGEEHQLGVRSSWVKEGLRNYYDENLLSRLPGGTEPLPLHVAKKNAPGLFA